MAQMLTDKACSSAKAREKSYKLRDGRGLYLLVIKTGSKSWRFDYKLKISDDTYKNGTYVYGLYPEFSLAEARALHAETHKLVSQGIDPNGHKKKQERLERESRALTFRNVTQEWLEKRRAEVKKRTADDIEKRLNMDVLPEIGDIPMQDINAPALLAMVKKIEERGAYEMANRSRQYTSQILRYAIARGQAERDFTLDISDALAVHKTKHQPALEPKDIPEFLAALERNDARLYPQTRLALKMLMLTFVRPIELASAEWSEFDFEDNRWIIPDSKMKMGFDHIVPLSRQTLDILRKMRPLTGKRQYVFPKQTNPKEHMHRDSLSKAVRALGFQDRHSAHGFRALARTAIREKLNYDSEIIERQLAHAPNTSLGRAYDRTKFIEQRTEMMQSWADFLDNAVSTGKVIVGKFGEAA